MKNSIQEERRSKNGCVEKGDEDPVGSSKNPRTLPRRDDVVMRLDPNPLFRWRLMNRTELWPFDIYKLRVLYLDRSFLIKLVIIPTYFQ